MIARPNHNTVPVTGLHSMLSNFSLISKRLPISLLTKTPHLQRDSQSDNVRLINLPRCNQSFTCPLGISRASRLRNMSSGLFISGHGVLLCGGLHVGRHFRRYRPSKHRRLQYCLRCLSTRMCKRTTEPYTLKGTSVCVPCTATVHCWYKFHALVKILDQPWMGSCIYVQCYKHRWSWRPFGADCMDCRVRSCMNHSRE